MAQLVKVKVDLEGKELTHYTGVKIWQDVFKHHRFEVIVPFELLEEGDEHFFNQSHKVCGKKVTFSFATAHTITKSSQKESFDFVFKGIITSISLRSQGEYTNCFLISGYSPTILMEDSTTRKVYKKMTVGDIVGNVVGNYPSNVLKRSTAPSSSSVLPYIVQYNETNYEFITRLADEYGEWCYYNGTDLIFGKESRKEVKFSVDGIQAFDVSIMLQPTKFNVSAYTYADDQLVKSIGTVSVDGLNQFGEFALDQSDKLFATTAEFKADKVIFSASDLDNLAKVKRSMKASNLVVFEGNGEVPNISIGTVVDVTGTLPAMGGRGTSVQSFGKYIVTEIEHTVDATGNYSNSFKAIPESVKFPPPNPHVKRPAGYSELATVTDNQDPDKLGRVKVRFYWPGQPDSVETDWIRVSSFYSGGGDGLGMFFIPEVAAQVVIGYEQNHPEYPFVMTSMYPHSSDVRTASSQNEEKFFQTAAGNQISLNDKNGQNKIEITNKNVTDTAITIEFQQNGIISLKTKGKVNITADEAISLKTNQKLTMEAMDIEIKASNGLKIEATANASVKTAQLKLNADATAELKAGASVKVEGAMTEIKGTGMTTISGGMVKIN